MSEDRAPLPSRRTLLRTGLLGGALAVVTRPLLAVTETATQERPAPGPVPPSAPPAPPAAVGDFTLEEATFADMQTAMTTGRLTCRALVEAYLARIAALDRRGPGLRAVLELNPDALALADALDAESRAKGARGPLHGIPILLKDNVDTHDGMTTTAGSLALAGSVPARDAFVVRRLRAQGALLLGKANLSEWANFRSTRSSSGWSGRGGQCRNPYALDRSPSGSSSGSAVAAAANLCAAAVGTETDGSIVSPASHCCLVGIKPTVGLLSRSGIIPIAHSQDTAGPLARTVTDAAILLGAMTGAASGTGADHDPDDPATRADLGRHGRRVYADYTQFLRADGLRGARIGVARRHFFTGAPSEALIEEALAALRHAGAEIVDPADLATAGQLGEPEMVVLLHEFKADLDRYLAALPPSPGLSGASDTPVRSLAALIAWNERHRDREMPYFGQELLLSAAAKGPLTAPAYVRALAACRRLSRRQGIYATLARHRLDALVAPTGGPPWLIDLVNGDSSSGGSSTPAAVAGYPSITVPAGLAFGLPVGLSFFAGAWSEPTLLRLAYAFEQATRHRRPPRYLPTAELSLVQ